MSTTDLQAIGVFASDVIVAYANNEIKKKHLLRAIVAIQHASLNNSDKALEEFAKKYLHLGQS